jgi:hypothetical protein
LVVDKALTTRDIVASGGAVSATVTSTVMG